MIFFLFTTAMPDFPMGLHLQHNLAHPADFWSPGFGIHPSLIPAANHMLHPNLMPNYKIPNIHAIMQYMGLNSLFNGDRNAANGNYATAAQNLSINTSTTTRSSSPSQSNNNSPVESPNKDLEK